MIIGGNNNPFPSEQDRFRTKLNQVNENQQLHQTNQWNQLEGNPLKSYDVESKNEMADKSLAILQDRLNQGLISMDEFHQKCEQINKQRENY
jgi:hypothetical protein